jgi:predicted tellurium resistance membrane protein TerC
VINKFYLLKYGLAIVLTFIGVKMVIEHWLPINTLVSLSVVAVVLTASIVASIIWPEAVEEAEDEGKIQNPKIKNGE